jgi:WD40 repeat protein/DNA-binding SARP family transcriptional activator
MNRQAPTSAWSRADLPRRTRGAYGPSVRFQVLGPLEVAGPDGPIALGAPKQRAVLAHLLVSANRVVPAETLIDRLWGEDPPETARNTLQTYVSHLRKALGPDRIEGRSPGYVLHVEPAELDSARFEHLLAEAREADGQADLVSTVLREALELWRGPAFADVARDGLAAEIARLDELRLGALEQRIDADLAAGHHDDLIGELDGLTREHPLRERLWAHLMLALYRSGRQADALGAFQRARELLADELGVDPSPELVRLHERVLRQDPDLELVGTALRGYRLLDQVGEGAFGVVHRAIQPQVGREVAVKSIHPELANQPDFVRRFEREAQLVARLEHPHVVPLYDYWREPDGAYLVMRFLRGGSVEDLLEQGPLELGRITQILDQVAGALSAAHRQGVVHRDVKPGNILLDEGGNAYLTDFGVALDAGAPDQTTGTMVRGTPAYLSPEQIRLEPITPRSDIYALGVVLFEMLTGEYPYPESSLTALLDQHLNQPMPSVRAVRSDVPVSVEAVVARATAKDPAERFADATELAIAFRSAIESPTTVVERELRNPYKGLRAFLEADAADFFGREALTRRLVERLAERGSDARFLCVVGPSGSGKSSVVRAGLIPALRRGAVEGSDRWYMSEVLPGRHPLHEIESALLGIAVSPPPSLLEVLEEDELGLVHAVEKVLPDPSAELVLVLDQLEELFTLVEDEAERAHVLDLIRAVALGGASRVRVVATLRADFFDEPLSVRGFGDLLAARTEAITPMSPAELERAISGPAEHVGLAIEGGLVASMVADVVDRPGALPLLQYALTELAERGSELTSEGYRAIGGVSGALARRAEHLYAAMNETGREACRRLFLRLVTLGEGTEDTRRRVRRSELPSAEGGAIDAVVETFGRHRLLSFDRDPLSREPTVEIAHEALLRAWARLRGWIDEARDDLRTERGLTASAAEWETAGHDESFLIRGVRLEQVSTWAETSRVGMTESDGAFLRASLARRDEELALEASRQARERALERRSVKRLRAFVAALTAAALVAGVLSAVAVGQRGQAQREARLASARELAAAAEANLEVDPERSILLALQAMQTTHRDGTVLPEARQALHDSLDADRLIFTIQNPSTANVAYSPNGRLLATGGTAGGNEQDDVLLWDARTGALVRRLSGHTDDIDSVEFNFDGSRLVTAADDSTVIEWDARTGRRLLTVPGTPGDALQASFSPDGRMMAIADTGTVGGIRLVDARTGNEIRTIDPGVSFCGPSFSPDGSLVAAGCSGDVIVWSVATGRETLRFPWNSCGGGVVFSPDGTRITASSCGAPKIWSAETGREQLTLEGHTGDVYGLAWSPDGTRLATGSTDGTARVWDASTGKQLMVLAGHAGLVAIVDFSPDGTRLLTGGGDGTARVWDVTPAGASEAFGAADLSDLNGVVYNHDGSQLLTTAWPEGGWLWDTSTGERDTNLPDAYADGNFSSDDSTVLAEGRWEARQSWGLRSLDAASGDQTAFVELPCCLSALSPDGTVVATIQDDGTLRLWNRSSGARLRTFHVLAKHANADAVDVGFSPDGRLVAGIGRDVLRVWEVSTGGSALDLRVSLGLSTSLAFGPDGARIATAGGNGAAVWSLRTGDRITSLGGAGSIASVVFSADGRRIATAGDDGAARIWDAGSGRQLLRLGGHAQSLAAVAFSPDGTRLATTSSDGILRVYVLPVSQLIRLARERLSRGFTTPECRQYLHQTSCPSPAGIASPVPRTVTPHATSPIGPDGVYRLRISRADLESHAFPKPRSGDAVGTFTLSLVGGIWRIHQLRSEGDAWDTQGTYTVSGDRITFTDQADVWCFGNSWSGRWSSDGTDLSFAGISSTGTSTCDAPLDRAWTQALFGTYPWTRVNHHELGG